MTNQQQTTQTTQTRYLRIKKKGYRPGMAVPVALQVQLARKTLNLHFAIPTAGVEAADDEITAAGALRDRLRNLHFVNECCRCQDKGQVGVKFQVSEGAENHDKLLSSAFLQLREIVEGSELLRKPGATWRAIYETGALADEGLFTTSPAPGNDN